MINQDLEKCKDEDEDENVSVISEKTIEQVTNLPLASSYTESMASLPPPKKKKCNKSSNLEQSVNKLHEIALMTNETDDEYDRFGMHISAQLKQLPLRSFITLQEKIQSLITQERLKIIDSQNNQTEYPFSIPTSSGRSSNLSQTSFSSSSHSTPIIHTGEYQELPQCNDQVFQSTIQSENTMLDPIQQAILNICSNN